MSTAQPAPDGVGSLLSRHNTNPKMMKAERLYGIRTAIMHLAPAELSGYEVCPARSVGCTSACLHYAGAPFHQNGKTRARKARTRFFFEDRIGFMSRLHHEVAAHVRSCSRHGVTPAVRLNGTSDLAWERIKGTFGTIIDAFPDVQFYDYTAVVNRLRQRLPLNYHLTFSLKEDNWAQALEAVRLGFNLSVVFRDHLPNEYLDLPVLDGDEHDFRPLDPRQCIVGLAAKGQAAKADITGFIQDPDFTRRMAA